MHPLPSGHGGGARGGGRVFKAPGNRVDCMQLSGNPGARTPCTGTKPSSRRSNLGFLSHRRGLAHKKFKLKLVEELVVKEDVGLSRKISCTNSARLGSFPWSNSAGFLTWLTRAGVFAAVFVLVFIGNTRSFKGLNKLEADMLHPVLPSIQTKAPTPSTSNRPAYEWRDHYPGKLRDPEADRAKLDVSMLEMTVERAPEYVSALQVPNPRNWNCWVSDQARVLNREAVEHLNSVIDALKYDTGTEVTVVSVRALGQISAKEFAASLYKAWRIDQDSQGRGLLLLVVAAEGRVEVELGWNMEKLLRSDSLWDSGSGLGWVKSLVNGRVLTDIRRGEYDKGIVEAVEKVAERVWETAGLSAPRRGGKTMENVVDVAWMSFFPMCGLGYLFLPTLARKLSRNNKLDLI